MKADILRYLNVDKADEALNQKIESYTKELKELGKYHYGIFELNDLKVLGTRLELQGLSIKNFLKDVSHLVLFAATLGNSVDQKINKLKYQSAYDLLIYDACANAIIDDLLDQMMKEIKGYYQTPRYSPGYGDMPLSHQRDIINILKADKILGITINDSDLMIPMKSVTGCIGLSKKTLNIKYDICDDCLLRHQCDHTTCRRGQ